MAYFRDIGISYLSADEDGENIPSVLEKLKTKFGINKLLLEGGSDINTSFAHYDVIDELSLVIAPVVANMNDKPLFRTIETKDFELTQSKTYDNGVIWLNYRRK